MSTAKDLTGRKFGRLTAVRRVGTRDNNALWECICDCGTVKNYPSGSLVTGNTKSCGCLKSETTRKRFTTHGMSQSSEHSSWTSMKNRCTNERGEDYEYYGGRGITVCDRWLHSFENFLADMGPKPADKRTIERNDVNGNYEPGNCRWASQQEQVLNSRHCHMVTFAGKTMTIADWSRETGINRLTLQSRLLKFGWSPEKALTKQPKNPYPRA